MIVLKRSLFFLYLIWVFLKEFILSNLTVAYTILFVKSSNIHPSIVDFNTDSLTKYEVMVLAQLITLTPGTITVEIDEEKNKLKIHILNSSDPQKVLERIKERLQKALLGVTRC